jgi:hypothetical protein
VTHNDEAHGKPATAHGCVTVYGSIERESAMNFLPGERRA